MRSFYQLVVLALPLFSAVAAEPKLEAEHPKTIYASAQEAFQDLLNALPEESLQAALSGLKGFKNGVFESHHRGVEHVHDSNPELATKLIVDAVNDLKKRQTPSNGTTTVTEAAPPPESTEASSAAPQTSEDTSPPPAESSAPPPAETVTQTQTQQQTQTQTQIQTQTQTQQTQQSQQSNEPADPTTVNAPPETVTETQQRTTTARRTTTQQRPAIIPVEATVTEDGTTVVRTTQVLSQVTASVAVTVTRTNQRGSTVTATENRPAVIKTTTDRAGRTTVTTSAANYAPTAGEVQTGTDEGGSTFLTTFTPGGGLVSSVKLITTTDAAGRQSTMTTYEFVDPVQATPTAGGDGGGDGGNDGPSLQTGAAAQMYGKRYAAVGLGAVAFFF